MDFYQVRNLKVTDMMVANATNLIITVKPASQKNNIQKSYKFDPRYQTATLSSQGGAGQHQQQSDSDSDGDEVRDLSSFQPPPPPSAEKNTDKHEKRQRGLLYQKKGS